VQLKNFITYKSYYVFILKQICFFYFDIYFFLLLLALIDKYINEDIIIEEIKN